MPMNLLHRKLCSSEKWAGFVAEELPRRLAGFELGDNVLELGPGFGATTSVLADLAPKLTSLEIDDASVTHLRAKFGDRVTVVHGDGARMPFEDNTFSAVVCFTMLHHVPTTALQDAIFAEACRVLRPGGIIRATDSQLSFWFRLLHIGDTMNVLDVSTLSDRLAGAGFSEVEIEHAPKRIVKFSAVKSG
ncbi:class I SAM-dependent methyltransferase [Amycolatopsis sp. NPDC059657]|uniref:class I SAM-dependent methyltransferase n=1 Tax=Amycolatopsis sp. NPDC059657 TaxID=3346899 RepID=UPI00366CEDFD